MLLVAGLLAAALAGCGTTAVDLASSPPNGIWRFSSDLETVSTCLMRAMNAEYQPKSAAAQFWGRSILHSIVPAGPGINHIVHEHIGPSAAWLFVVRSVSAKSTIAETHAAQTLNSQEPVDRMQSAAMACSGAA